MLRMLLPATMMVCALPVSGSAQQVESELESVLRQAQLSEWTLRATLADSTHAEGRVEMAADSVRIGGADIALESVRLIELMRSGRGGVVTGAKWGGGVGLVIGGGYMLLCMSLGDCNSFELVAIYTGLGAFLGGAIGGALDTSVRWEPIWPET